MSEQRNHWFPLMVNNEQILELKICILNLKIVCLDLALWDTDEMES